MDEEEYPGSWFNKALSKEKDRQSVKLNDESKWREIGDGSGFYTYVGDVRTDPNAQKNWNPEQANTVNYNGRTYTRAKDGYYYNPEDTEQVRDALGNTVTRPKKRSFAGYTAKELIPHEFVIRPKFKEQKVAFLKGREKYASNGYANDYYSSSFLPVKINDGLEDGQFDVIRTDRLWKSGKRERLPFTFDQIMNPAYKKQIMNWIKKPGYDNEQGYKALQDAVSAYHDYGQAFGVNVSAINNNVDPFVKRTYNGRYFDRDAAVTHPNYDYSRDNGRAYLNGFTYDVPYPTLFDFVKRYEVMYPNQNVSWNPSYGKDFFVKFEKQVEDYSKYIQDRKSSGKFLSELNFNTAFRDRNGKLRLWDMPENVPTYYNIYR